MEGCRFWVKSFQRKIKCFRTLTPHYHLCIKCSVSCYKTSTYDFIAILQTCTVHYRTQRQGTVRTCDALFEAASAASRMACIVFEEVWNAIVARSKVRSRFLKNRDKKIKNKKVTSWCVCVCVRERERERR